jgi:hypothetical protein
MIEWHLDIIDRLYAPSAPAIRKHRVEHEQLRTFCNTVARLGRELAGSESDSYWMPLIRNVRRARFVSTAAPLALATIYRPTALEEMRERYLRNAFPYPRLRPLVVSVLDMWAGFVADWSNPLMNAVQTIIGDGEGRDAIVLADPRLAGEVRAALRALPPLAALDVLTQHDMRREIWFERLVLFGNPAWYDSSLFAAPRGAAFELVRFSWVPGRISQAPLLSAITWTEQADKTLDGHEVDAADDAGGDDGWLNDSRIADLIVLGSEEHRPARDAQQELIEVIWARPVLLEGGGGVFLETEDHASVLILDLEEDERRRVHRIPVDDVVVGTYVLLRSGGAGDHVIPVADGILGARRDALRAMQREWKKRLREEVRRSSLLEVSLRLLELGAVRAEEGNLRRWIWERSIRPQDRADFDAILRLVGLDGERDRYWSAMGLIDRAHLRAGQVIRKALLEQVREADLGALQEGGRMEFDLPGEETGGMVACRVLQIGRQQVQVPIGNVGKLLHLEDV